MNLYMKKAVVLGPEPGTKRNVEQIYVRGTEIVFIVLPEMLRHAPMFNRIKHWRKYGGAPPEGVGAAVGQAAAILRKASERRRGGFAGGGMMGGRGGFGGGGRGGGAGGGGGGGGGGGRGGGGPPGGGYGGGPTPGHYSSGR